MAKEQKKIRGSYKNITNWLDPKELIITVKGEVTGAKYCENEAARWKKDGFSVKVEYDEDGMVAVRHGY